MLENSAPSHATRRPAKGRRRILTGIALLLLLLFAGLGTWQVVRLQWKLALIERVDARVRAAPVPAPSVSPHSRQWPAITAANDEYRHVRLTGHFLFDLTTPVQAVTVHGSGFWLITPLCRADGTVVLVNRGFIPGALGGDSGYRAGRAPAHACADAGVPVTVDGLMRLTEPKGGFLRENDPASGRWYSRDIAAIAAARGIAQVAPYFVDAGARQPATVGPQEAAAPPVGGLTVIAFPNNHLVYALTWFALAAMVGAAWWWIARRYRPAPAHPHDADA